MIAPYSVGIKNMKRRYGGKTRKDYYYQMAHALKVPQDFVDALFEEEKERGRTLDVGSRIRSKARIYKPRRKFDTKNISSKRVQQT